MWDPYVASASRRIGEKDRLRLSIAAYLAKAVDQVRRAENKRLLALGQRLTGHEVRLAAMPSGVMSLPARSAMIWIPLPRASAAIYFHCGKLDLLKTHKPSGPEDIRPTPQRGEDVGTIGERALAKEGGHAVT